MKIISQQKFDLDNLVGLSLHAIEVEGSKHNFAKEIKGFVVEVQVTRRLIYLFLEDCLLKKSNPPAWIEVISDGPIPFKVEKSRAFISIRGSADLITLESPYCRFDYIDFT